MISLHQKSYRVQCTRRSLIDWINISGCFASDSQRYAIVIWCMSDSMAVLKYFLSHALVVIILQQFTMEILQDSNVNQTLRNFIIEVIYVFVDDIENAYTCSVLNINEILRLKWNMNDSYDFFFPSSCESTFTLEIVITINLNIQFRMMKFFRNHSIYYSCQLIYTNFRNNRTLVL